MNCAVCLRAHTPPAALPFPTVCVCAAPRRSPAWCCAGANLGDGHDTFFYAAPRPLAKGWAAWAWPRLRRPTWCEKVARENVVYTHYANHPCQFLKGEEDAEDPNKGGEA